MNIWQEMETRSALPVRTLNAKKRCNFGSSGGTFPSPLPIMPNTSAERFTKPLDPPQVPVETGMTSDALSFHCTPFVTNYGNNGATYSSPSGTPDHLYHERNVDDAPFLPQLRSAGVSLPSAYSPYTGTFQVPINIFSNDPVDVTWCPDSVHGSLNYSHDEITGNTPGDDLNKQDEWWSGVMNEDWKELIKDAVAAEPQRQVVYPNPYAEPLLGISTYGSHSLRHSNELAAVTSQLPAASTSALRPRMRWSPELHERFVDAINQLGGDEKATPKGILNIMKVEGLTISHVKSHLQKFRTACRPLSSEGIPEKKTAEIEDLPSLNLKTGIDLTEALRIQMEVQKRLHEQLEEQRELQLQIEKQGRYLQEIIENQRKATMEKFHASSTMEESTTDETASAAKVVHRAAGSSCSIDSNATEGRQVGDKRKMPEFETSEDNEMDALTSSPPQQKQAKTNNGDYDDGFR